MNYRPLYPPHLREQILAAIGKGIVEGGGPAAFARLMNVSTTTVTEWRDEKRAVPPARGARFERAANGVVGRRDLWPDTYAEIWPELAPASQPANTAQNS
ncbi:MAG: helix-turn-helix domain-containing protein [Burkholderiales bacterium]|nr:helix-turn-helix domain-containing protein [Burkholderiales bacterium]